LGLSAGIEWETESRLDIDNNTHYITSPFTLGPLTVLSSDQSLARLDGSKAPDLSILGTFESQAMLVAIDTGGMLFNGGTADGRRVQLPWGGAGFSPNSLNSNGVIVLQRSLEWAAGAGESGGSGDGGSGGCNGTYRDEFNNQVYSGNDGTLNWVNDWEEINESDGPNLNDERVFADLYESPPMPTYQLHVRDNDGGGEGVMRRLNLSGAASATLSFDYKPAGLDNASDYASVQMSTSGTAGPWTEVVRFAGPANETAYQPYSTNISTFISADAVLRIITSPNMGSSDYVFFDNIQIRCTP
jgi:hypothetical protein